MENVINKKSVLVVGAIAAVLTMGLLCGCSGGGSEDKAATNDATSSEQASSTSDGFIQADAHWSYEAKSNKTTLKRDDGYEFIVNEECSPTFIPNPTRDEQKTSFGVDTENVMSFEIRNDQDSIKTSLGLYDSSTYGCVEKDGVKCFWSEKYGSSNSVKIWHEKENLWLDVIYGTETITSQSTVEEILNEFEF